MAKQMREFKGDDCNEQHSQNVAELHDRKYISFCVLNTYFTLTVVVLNSVMIHAIRKTSSASLLKNLRVLLLNLAFSDLSVGLVVQPFI